LTETSGVFRFVPFIKEVGLMLVLTRKMNESIVIDGGIRITVVHIKGNKVRLGIAAPDDIRVDRQEVAQRMFDLTAPAAYADAR